MTARTDSTPWHAAVAVAEVPEDGRHVDLETDAETRAALARLAGVRGISTARADFDLSRRGAGGLRVVGQIHAVVEQDCVVTLEPLSNRVEETLDLVFMPPKEAPEAKRVAVPEADNDDAPEVLVDGRVDLGAVATEFLLLGIDPYPRKPGVSFDAPPAAKDPAEHPFAALAALKNRKPESGE